MKPFKQFQEAAIAAPAIAGASKYIIPLLMTGIGAAGTILQARRLKKKRKIGAMEKRLMDREQGDRSNDMIVAKPGEVQKQNKLIDKYENIQKSTENNLKRKNFIKRLKGVIPEEAMAAPTNSMGGGNIAGSIEAGDEPPVNKRKKKGEPTIIARGCMPGARSRFKSGVQLLASLKKNK